jgi:hypothetical protein
MIVMTERQTLELFNSHWNAIARLLKWDEEFTEIFLDECHTRYFKSFTELLAFAKDMEHAIGMARIFFLNIAQNDADDVVSTCTVRAAHRGAKPRANTETGVLH